MSRHVETDRRFGGWDDTPQRFFSSTFGKGLAFPKICLYTPVFLDSRSSPSPSPDFRTDEDCIHSCPRNRPVIFESPHTPKESLSKGSGGSRSYPTFVGTVEEIHLPLYRPHTVVFESVDLSVPSPLPVLPSFLPFPS